MSDKGTTLGNDQALYQGDFLSSQNGYYLVMQTDGNLVLYQTKNWVSQMAIWASGTNGKGTDDGNLVIYDNFGVPTWASNTHHQGAKPHKLVMQNDRNLVIYDGNNIPTWATNTNI